MEKKKKKTGWRGPEGSDIRGFRLNPENINKKGRPRKAFGSFNHELKESGLEAVTRGQFRDAVLNLMNLTEVELELLANDGFQPQALRIMAKELLQPKTRAKYLQEIRDWSLGQPKQELEVKATLNGFNPAEVLLGAVKPKDDEETED